MKVAEVTQIKVTPFKHGIPRSSWWFWFKCQHQNIAFGKLKVWKLAKHKG
jgi:hypothetical protein